MSHMRLATTSPSPHLRKCRSTALGQRSSLLHDGSGRQFPPRPPAGGSPLCRAGQNNRKCHRKGGGQSYVPMEIA